MVSVSLDTSTRQFVLVIDGVLVPSTDVMIEKYVYDGEEFLRFSYTIELTDVNGMRERRQFYLPSKEELATEAHAELNADGLSSKIVYDDEKAKADVIDFLKQGRKS
jgi:hypothetical protein